ncbi:hypothetical protein G9A89_023950 [Geosiphon pyriformis]|nr:hypothetical protein G9A89_023950 [Geosiphon pyriformis]
MFCNHSRISDSDDTIESKSIDIKEEYLVEETSINYEERNAFDGRDPNQTPKSSGLKIKTKKVLGKPLGKINFEDGFDDGDFLDESAFLLLSFLLKSSVQVSVRKFFALNIDLVAVAKKSSQEKSNFIKKFFSGVNGFGGGVSTLSKFGGIIYATFTSKKAMMVIANLANEGGVVVNTDLKHSGYNHMNWAIVLKEIPVRTSIKTVHAAVSEFGIIKSIKMQLVGLWQKAFADLLVSMWSILIGKDAVHVARADIDKQTWDSRNKFRTLLYTLSLVVIDHNSVNYICACCATVCFDSEENMNQAVAVMPVIKSKLVPISHSLAFGKKTWASVAGSFSLGSFLGYDSQLGSLRNSKPLPPVVNNLESHLVNIESSLVSLVRQIITPLLQNQEKDIVMEMSLGKATSGKTAVISGSNASPEIVKLKNMLEDLSALIMSLLAHLDGLAWAGGASSLPFSQ